MTKILRVEEFVNEQATANDKSKNTPLECIMDGQGKILASLPTLKDKDTDFLLCPKYEFVFPNVKTKKEFEDTTYSNDFWKAVYDYDSIFGETNDYKVIDANMKKFGNKIVGKKLYIYCYDKKDSIELQKRCEAAKNTCDFVTVKYTE